MSLRCVIVDDEPAAIEVLSNFVERTPDLDLIQFFRDPMDALSFLKKNKTDLLFLDINMPTLTGIELAKVLGSPPLIIFTTAYSEYALQSYDLNAVDYLMKPISFERFLIAVNKALGRINNIDLSVESDSEDSASTEEIIYLKSGPKTYRVSINSINYLEKDGHYITFHTEERRIMVRLSMKDVFELIPADTFKQIHKSFIVAVPKVTVIENHQLKIDDRNIPVGKTFRKEVHELFNS